MYKTTVFFESVAQAKQFVNICNELDYRIELVADPYVIDAKSIMGIFSLDFSKPISLRAFCPDAEEFKNKIGQFLVENQ